MGADSEWEGPLRCEPRLLPASERQAGQPPAKKPPGAPWQRAEEREGGSERKGVQRGRGPSFRKPRCVWGEGRGVESGELSAPAPAVCSQFWGLSSPPGCPVASALGHGLPLVGSRASGVLSPPGPPHPAVALPVDGWSAETTWAEDPQPSAARAHLHPAWLLPATACSSPLGRPTSTWAQHL